MKRLKKLAIGMVIASVAISGSLGIFALLARSWGKTQERIVLTTVVITVTCLLLLCSAAMREKREAKVLPAAGTLLALAGMVMMLGSIWHLFRGQAFEKAMGVVMTFSAVTALLCLLSLANLAKGFRWALWISFLAWYGLASKLSLMIIADNGSDLDMRIAGVLSIVGGCLTILIPIFHRICSAAEEAAREAASGRIHCPCCGARMDHGAGVQQCPACGRSFTLEIRPLQGTTNQTE
jgi:hypothetical protein